MDFTTHSPLASLGATPSSLDFNGLNSLRRSVQVGGADLSDKQREVARQFEAIFIQMMLKQARKQSELMPSLFDSPAERMMQSMSDEQAALTMADPGIGLADALMAQMRGGVLKESGGASDAARTGLQSGRRDVADSIGSLVNYLTRHGSGDRIGGAIQGAPEHIRTFVDRMSAAAELASRNSGVPAKLILSQAALESGWGEREIMRPDGRTTHNLFGIKAGNGWHGDVVNVMTTEYENGEPRRMVQPFRAYRSYAESFQDYADLIGNSERYGKVTTAPTAETAARQIQAAGYATDPGYADKLISIMGYFNAR